MGNAHILGIFGRGKVRGTSGPPIPPAPATFSAPRKRMKLQPHLKVLASVLRGLLLPTRQLPRHVATVRRGVSRSEFYFISGIRRKKFPNPKPKAESAPIPLFFPLFPAAKLVIQTSTRRIEKLRRKKTRGFSARRQKKLFLRYPFSGSGGAIISPPSPSGLAAAASASVEGAAAPVLRLNSSGSVGVNSPRTIL